MLQILYATDDSGCARFHQKLHGYKCMLFVDFLVVLREYFVN